ncbi:hypothetical protein LTR15_011912 [Elasticomyces elasticus]|nr:hypothetical protein LTR15_011912 [Elasticomyces elasticus]
MITYCWFASSSSILEITTSLNKKPIGCGDDAAEFHASFTNWAIKLFEPPIKDLKPSQAAVKAILRDGFPETNAAEYIRALTLYGKQYRWHGRFHNGIIKIEDVHDSNSYLEARKQLFAHLFSKAEKAAFFAQHPAQYPLQPPVQRSRDGKIIFRPLLPKKHAEPRPPPQYEYHKKTDFEFTAMSGGIAAQWGEDASGMPLRTIEGGDSDMAWRIDGLGVSHQEDEEVEQ